MKRIACNNKKMSSSNPVSSALIIVIPRALSLSVHCTSHYYHKITPPEKEKPHPGSLNMTRGHMTITQGRRFQELPAPTISPDEISPIVKSYEVDPNRSTIDPPTLLILTVDKIGNRNCFITFLCLRFQLS